MVHSFMLDFAGQHIGSQPTLPYLSPQLTGQQLLVGANFASAGVGILNDTGIQFVSPTLSALFSFGFLDNLAVRPGQLMRASTNLGGPIPTLPIAPLFLSFFNTVSKTRCQLHL